MVLLLSAMTLVTFTYVVVTNLYSVFYDLGDAVPLVSQAAFAAGDFLVSAAQEMTWSLALTKAMFAWLIFIGTAYGVRVGAHIGVDILTRLFPKSMQRVFGGLACLVFICYAGLLVVSSYHWLQSLLATNVGVEDLDQFGIREWQVAIIEPIGLALVIARLAEVMVRILRGTQIGLEQASEVDDALELMAAEHRSENEHASSSERH